MNNYNLTYNFKPTYEVSSTYQTTKQKPSQLDNLFKTYTINTIKPYFGEGQQSMTITEMYERNRGYQ